MLTMDRSSNYVPWEKLSLLILQVLNISGNNVPLLGRRHFARLGLTNLQRIAASRCGLVQIDSLAFIGLTNLVELDLALNELIEVTSNIYSTGEIEGKSSNWLDSR